MGTLLTYIGSIGVLMCSVPLRLVSSFSFFDALLLDEVFASTGKASQLCLLLCFYVEPFDQVLLQGSNALQVFRFAAHYQGDHLEVALFFSRQGLLGVFLDVVLQLVLSGFLVLIFLSQLNRAQNVSRVGMFTQSLGPLLELARLQQDPAHVASVFSADKPRPLHDAHVRVLLSQVLELDSEVLTALGKVGLSLVVQMILALHLTNEATRLLEVWLAKVVVSAETRRVFTSPPRSNVGLFPPPVLEHSATFLS